MTYLEELAEEMFSTAHPDREASDAERSLFIIYAVVSLVVGGDVTAANVHDAWAAWALERHPSHPSIRPFQGLPEDVRRKGERYADAIRQFSLRRGGRR